MFSMKFLAVRCLKTISCWRVELARDHIIVLGWPTRRCLALRWTCYWQLVEACWSAERYSYLEGKTWCPESILYFILFICWNGSVNRFNMIQQQHPVQFLWNICQKQQCFHHPFPIFWRVPRVPAGQEGTGPSDTPWLDETSLTKRWRRIVAFFMWKAVGMVLRFI